MFANLDQNAMPLHEFLGDLPDRYKRVPFDDLVLYKRKEYDIHANWKLIAENYIGKNDKIQFIFFGNDISGFEMKINWILL